MTAKGKWFALKIILFDSISDSYIPNDFSWNWDKFSPLPSPLDLHFGLQKGPNSVKSAIMAAQGEWFGLKTILIDFISGSDIS
jgi:hypothetical protein